MDGTGISRLSIQREHKAFMIHNNDVKRFYFFSKLTSLLVPLCTSWVQTFSASLPGETSPDALAQPSVPLVRCLVACSGRTRH